MWNRGYFSEISYSAVGSDTFLLKARRRLEKRWMQPSTTTSYAIRKNKIIREDIHLGSLLTNVMCLR